MELDATQVRCLLQLHQSAAQFRLQRRLLDESKTRYAKAPGMNDTNEQGNGVDGELQAHIGRKLKASYDDILGQPVPDRFLELLKALDEKEKGAADSISTGSGEDAR